MRRDWTAVRKQLDANRAAMEAASSADPARMKAAYDERAARLARPAAGSVAPAGSRPVLVFRIGSARFGIELERISEILSGPRCTPVPGSAPELAGFVQVRGEIRPVWDLARLLALPEAAESRYAVMLRFGPVERGLLVGAVEGILSLAPRGGGPPAGAASHVKWITPDLIAVLDPDGIWKREQS